MPSPKNVLVVGSSNTEMIIRVPHLPSSGVNVLGRGFSMAAGGKGANQAVAAARAIGRPQVSWPTVSTYALSFARRAPRRTSR